MFRDRVDAGRQLAGALGHFRGDSDAVVFGIPRGGVVVAAEVARELGLPLDIVIAAKVGAPGNPEYAIGAVAPDGDVSVNPDAGYTIEDVRGLASSAHELIERRTAEYRRGRHETDVTGRTAIVVDDGLATGLTAVAASEYLRRRGAKTVVVAVPVAARSSAARLAEHADELIAVDVPSGFMAVGQFYEVFGQTSDAEVEALLEEAGGSV